ncbi:hypothetical protein ACFSC6_20060 [Rufibacter sediminis]|uniref:Uncharacterized protein n=1 Tax=Rufibacter sediminis TaxID=2762756 RepID=A0ABR6VNH3_9BACT|nr:hypothetical protein [Rufibacter sediminis]MBC3538744.1 hypothetical protein [Rufibacter sediminis]
MATETKRKVDWDNIVKQMAADKKRIDAYLENPEAKQINDITFVKPESIRATRSK